MVGRLTGKIAVITGAGGHIGGASVDLFAREGATVIATDIDADTLHKKEEQLSKQGLTVEFHAGVDMFDPDSVNAFIRKVGVAHEGIDVLVNAAAMVVFASLEDMTPDDFRRTMIGEVDTTFYACQAAWPFLKVRGGSVINFASVAGHMPVDGLPGLAHTAGKGAVLAMTRQLAAEGGPHGIRVNSISPGLTDTIATRRQMANRPTFRTAVERKIMIGRLGQPEDIAAGVLYLASDEASFVTATDLAIDGGMTAW